MNGNAYPISVRRVQRSDLLKILEAIIDNLNGIKKINVQNPLHPSVILV